MKKNVASFVSFGIFFAFMLLLAGVVNRFDGNISGNVVWEKVDYGNCSDNSIYKLWNGTFVHDNPDYNLEIEKKNQINGYCDEFFVYNYTLGYGLDVIYAELWNNSWNATKVYNLDDNSLVDVSMVYRVLHVNVSENFMNTFVTLSMSDKIITLNGLPFENPDNITNWSVQSSSQLNGNLSDFFEGDKFSDVSWEDTQGNWTFLNETLISGMNYSTNNYFAMKNETFVYFNYYSEYFDPDFYVDVLNNVSNFEFEPTTNWTFLFNWTNYLNFSSENNLTVDFSVDSNNSNGQWINLSVGNFGNVSFKPRENFTGIRNFSLKVISPSGVNTSTNVFNVLVNTEPEEIEDIDDIYVINVASVSVNLDNYFEDADGHDLAYGIYSQTDDINLTINNNVLTVRLLENFSSFDTFRLNITDGFSVIRSDKIYVYDNNDSDTYVTPTPGSGDDSGNENDDSSNDNSDEENNPVSTTSGNVEPITETDDPKKVLRIVIFSLLGVVGFAIVVIIVSLVIKSNKNKKIIKKSYSQPAITRPSVSSNQRPPLQQRMGNIPRRNFNNRDPRGYNPRFRR